MRVAGGGQRHAAERIIFLCLMTRRGAQGASPFGTDVVPILWLTGMHLEISLNLPPQESPKRQKHT